MFETSVVRVQARAADRRIGLLTLSIAAHAAIIAAVIAAGLASVQMPNQAPMQMTIPVFRTPPPALGTPDAKPAQKPPQPQAQPQRVPVPSQTVVAPLHVPDTTPQVASSSTSDAVTTTGGGGNTGQLGVPWGSPEGVGTDGPPAAPPLVEQSGPLVAGVGDVKVPVVLKRVSPPYPPLAAHAHMSGFVIVECVIDKTGVVRDAKVVKSTSAMFEPAALDAVKQWQFAPGTLYGKPVDTIFDLTVNFIISR